jgi:hypothetical protein
VLASPTARGRQQQVNAAQYAEKARLGTIHAKEATDAHQQYSQEAEKAAGHRFGFETASDLVGMRKHIVYDAMESWSYDRGHTYSDSDGFTTESWSYGEKPMYLTYRSGTVAHTATHESR